MVVWKAFNPLEHSLLMKLGGGILECCLGNQLVSFALLLLAAAIIQRTEVDSLVIAGLVEVVQTVADVHLVLLQLALHVLLLSLQSSLHLAGLAQLCSPLQAVISLVQNILGQVVDDTGASILAGGVASHLEDPQVLQHQPLGILQRQSSFIITKHVCQVKLVGSV